MDSTKARSITVACSSFQGSLFTIRPVTISTGCQLNCSDDPSQAKPPRHRLFHKHTHTMQARLRPRHSRGKQSEVEEQLGGDEGPACRICCLEIRGTCKPGLLPNSPASFFVPPASKANIIGPAPFAMPPASWAGLLPWHC
ncbi:hypothetical protein EYF80_037546 [Liparis tanakae]|uniref:Uncharacterized protein n=1 Tax=Liparis tanakae TaxID=230148 RepID=A0A4Z2GHU8_9TELE|nr:hypothetical protein EYF80_037546 [Liparis tanakae]